MSLGARRGPDGLGIWRRLLTRARSIHNLGLVGHIEDIAVAKDQQGKKLGLRIIQALDHVAEKVGCYKVLVARPNAEGLYTDPCSSECRQY